MLGSRQKQTCSREAHSPAREGFTDRRTRVQSQTGSSLRNRKRGEPSVAASPGGLIPLQTHRHRLLSPKAPLARFLPVCLRGSRWSEGTSAAMATLSRRAAQLGVLSGADSRVLKIAIESGKNKVPSLKLCRSQRLPMCNSSEVWLTHSGLKLD